MQQITQPGTKIRIIGFFPEASRAARYERAGTIGVIKNFKGGTVYIAEFEGHELQLFKGEFVQVKEETR